MAPKNVDLRVGDALFVEDVRLQNLNEISRDVYGVSPSMVKEGLRITFHICSLEHMVSEIIHG